MKQQYIFLIVIISMVIISCGKNIYPTNGETIYRTGRNVQGEKMIDKKASRIPLVNSCVTCHGKNGTAMKSVSVQFSYLSDADNFSVPYTDELFFRFLDKDLKSNGAKAKMGVIWKMSDKDKKDLLEYLKSL